MSGEMCGILGNCEFNGWKQILLNCKPMVRSNFAQKGMTVRRGLPLTRHVCDSLRSNDPSRTSVGHPVVFSAQASCG